MLTVLISCFSKRAETPRIHLSLIHIYRLYDLDNRKVKFIECYDNLGSGKPNGRQGEGVLSITDDGSGDAQNRENISFGLKILGTPQKGTVTIGEDGTPTFSPQAAEAKAASK